MRFDRKIKTVQGISESWAETEEKLDTIRECGRFITVSWFFRWNIRFDSRVSAGAWRALMGHGTALSHNPDRPRLPNIWQSKEAEPSTMKPTLQTDIRALRLRSRPCG